MRILLSLFILTAFIAAPAFAEDEDSDAKKLMRAKIIAEGDDDSLVTKAVKVDAAADVVKDDEDSGVDKAVKLKVLNDMAEGDDEKE